MLSDKIVYSLVIIQYGDYRNNWTKLVQDKDTGKRYTVPHDCLFGLVERGDCYANIKHLTEVPADEQA